MRKASLTLHHFVFIIAISLPATVAADVVELTNGDRISGEITELNGDTLKIKTHYSGTVAVDTLAIRSFHTSSQRTWQVNLKNRPVIVHSSTHSGHVVINAETLPIAELRLSPAVSGWKKSGLLETSLDVDNDQQRKEKLHVNAELNLESTHWRHEIKTESKRDKERNRITEDTIELNYTLDYLIDSHWLLRADSTYREEGVDVLTRYWYVGAGPGYRLWGEGKDKLDVIFAYNRLWLGTADVDWEFGAWALSLDYEQFWLDEKLETFSDFHISAPTIEAVDYIANTSSGLRYYFKHNIHISLKYDYNETRFIFGTTKDSSYVLGAGVNF